MKDYKRLTEKKEITECEIVSDKRYSVGFKQIPHKINRNIIRGVHTICNDMDGQGDYIIGDMVDKIADLEDKIESGEIVDRNAYLDYLMAAKDISGMTDKELEFFAKYNAKVRKEAVKGVLLTMLDRMDRLTGCGVPYHVKKFINDIAEENGVDLVEKEKGK